MQPHSSHFTLENMSSPDYFNGPANTQYPEDLFTTHCLVLCFPLLCMLPLITYFNSSICWAFVCIEDIIKCTYFHIMYIFKASHGSYILWKELKQLQSRTSIINNPKLAIYWLRHHHHMKSFSQK